MTGSKKLVYACIVDALSNIYSKDPSVREEAYNWISKDEDHLFSFNSCCLVFDLDPKVVRESLEKQDKWDYKVKRFRVRDL